MTKANQPSQSEPPVGPHQRPKLSAETAVEIAKIAAAIRENDHRRAVVMAKPRNVEGLGHHRQQDISPAQTTTKPGRVPDYSDCASVAKARHEAQSFRPSSCPALLSIRAGAARRILLRWRCLTQLSRQGAALGGYLAQRLGSIPRLHDTTLIRFRIKLASLSHIAAS